MKVRPDKVMVDAAHVALRRKILTDRAAILVVLSANVKSDPAIVTIEPKKLTIDAAIVACEREILAAE